MCSRVYDALADSKIEGEMIQGMVNGRAKVNPPTARYRPYLSGEFINELVQSL